MDIKEVRSLLENPSSLSNNQIDLLNDFAWDYRHTEIDIVEEILPTTKQLSIRKKYRKGVTYSDRVLAHVYLETGYFALALETSLRVYDQFQEMKEYRGMADALNSLGGVYNYLEDYENRLSCNIRCLELRKIASDIKGVISSLNNIGDTYLSMGNPNKAIEYFEEALETNGITDMDKTILINNLGEAFFMKGDFDLANEYFEKAYILAQKTKYSSIILNVELFKADILAKEESFNEAIILYNKVLVEIKKTKHRFTLLQIHKELAFIYDKMNNKELAFNHLKSHYDTQQELFGKNVIQKIKNIQFEKEFQTVKDESNAIKDINEELSAALNKLDKQNKELGLSINYAKLIQKSFLPNNQNLQNTLKNHFLLFLPKDKLSGDFYWVRENFSHKFIAVADCTGHGIPAALLSALCISALDRAIIEAKIIIPGLILEFVSEIIKNQLSQMEDIRDGMDISLLVFKKETKTVEWSGANNPIWIIEDKNIHEIKGTRKAIGEIGIDNTFQTHRVTYSENSTYYLFSDGYYDQFGGPFEKKLQSKNFKAILKEASSFSENKKASEYLAESFRSWKGNSEQTDDVCVLGFKL